jgi:5'-nucleotidase (lipoprotein e(P4) family)
MAIDIVKESAMRRTPALALLACLLLAGCASTPAPKPVPTAAATPPPASAPTPVPGDDALDAVLWSQRAVEHDLVFEEVYENAEQKLLEALADPGWDALPQGERDGSPAGLPPAVIADVDETLLDNSPYAVELITSGKEYDDFSWSQWCRKETAKPLPGALDFVRFAVAHGVKVFYITNRAVDLGPATMENLRKVGFPVPDDSVFLGLGAVVKGCQMLGTEKGCRRRLVGRDYRVLMQFGDQIGDFVDVLANTPAGRGQAVAPYAKWIGERWWVLPNPTYGSWQPACFNNDWEQPLERRRAAEIKCLRGE